MPQRFFQHLKRPSIYYHTSFNGSLIIAMEIHCWKTSVKDSNPERAKYKFIPSFILFGGHPTLTDSGQLTTINNIKAAECKNKRPRQGQK